jgi:transcriptional activator SPT8
MEDAEDIDADAEADGEGDADADADNDDDNDDNEENDEDDQDQDEIQDLFNDSPSQSQLVSKPEQSPALNASSSQGISSAPRLAPPSTQNPIVTLTSPSPRLPSKPPAASPFRPTVRQEALKAPVYDIVPTIAAPHGTSINAVTATPDMRWVFSGGTDGYIRKFNWVDTANGKTLLTVAQRHPFVDSVTKAGVLMSYWENEEPQSKSSNQTQS